MSVISQLRPGLIACHQRAALEVFGDPLSGVSQRRELLLVANIVVVRMIGLVFLTICSIYGWMVCPIIRTFLKIHECSVSVLFIIKEVFVRSEDFLTIKYRINHDNSGIVD